MVSTGILMENNLIDNNVMAAAANYLGMTVTRASFSYDGVYSAFNNYDVDGIADEYFDATVFNLDDSDNDGTADLQAITFRSSTQSISNAFILSA